MSKRLDTSNYSVVLRGIQKNADTIRLSILIGKLHKIDREAALVLLQESSILVKNDCSEAQAEQLYKLMRKLGANAVIIVNQVEPPVENNIRQYSQSRPGSIHSTFIIVFLTIFSGLVLGLVWFFLGEKIIHSSAQKLERPMQVGRNMISKVRGTGDYLSLGIKNLFELREELQKARWKNFDQLSPELLEKAIKAETYFEKALSLDPENVNIIHWRAQLADLMRRPALSEYYYQKGMDLDSNHIPIRLDYAHYLVDRENFGKAEYIYRSVLDKEPNNGIAHKFLGILKKYHLMDESGAKTHFWAYLQSENAKKDLDRYLIVKELSKLVWDEFNVDRLIKSSNERLNFDVFESKRKSIQAKIERFPKDIDLKNDLAYLYAQRGLTQASIEIWRDLNRHKNSREKSILYLSRLYMELEQQELAYRTLKIAESDRNLSSQFYRNLAILEKYYKQNTTASQKNLEKFREISGSSIEL
jgi:tetratricopeptide (TPR) repeat protein